MLALLLIASIGQTVAAPKTEFEGAADKMQEATDSLFAEVGVRLENADDRAWLVEQKANPLGQKRWITVSRTIETQTQLQVREFLSGPASTVWFRRKTPGDDAAGYTLSKTEVSCVARTMRSIALVVYRQDGSLAYQDRVREAKAREVMPDTAGERMLEAVCGIQG